MPHTQAENQVSAGEVDIEYTDNRCCYKVVHNCYQQRERVVPPPIRSERLFPASGFPTPPGLLRDDLSLVGRREGGPGPLERAGGFCLGVEDAREEHVVAGMKTRVAPGVEDTDTP